VVLSSTGWSGPILVPVLALSFSPALVVYNGLLYVFHQGGPGGGVNGDGQLHYAVFDGTNWSADIPLNIAMSYTPSAVAWADGISVFHHGPNYDGTLSYVFSPRWPTLGRRYTSSGPSSGALTRLCRLLILSAQNPAELRHDHGQLRRAISTHRVAHSTSI
jgi:hypothetical protein